MNIQFHPMLESSMLSKDLENSINEVFVENRGFNKKYLDTFNFDEN